MKQNTKDWIQYGSAIAMLSSAIILSSVSFVQLQSIHGSVLAYVGEAIAFAAGVYGIALYTQHEIRKQLRRLREQQRLEIPDIDEEDKEGGYNETE